MLVDTHCHLDFKDFDADREAVIKRAIAAGVGRIVNVGSSLDGSRRSLELSKRYDIVYASLGVHPHEASSLSDKIIDEFRRLADEKKVVAIGEVGLDYYRNLSPMELQNKAFRRFIKLAQDLDLPLILHTRDAGDEILDILEEEIDGKAKGVLHCFSQSSEFLKRCLKMGLYVSFTCNLTFKNAASLREVASDVPDERLLLETDAPFLAPQAVRGKRNEPAYLKNLVDEWVSITKLTADDIARLTTHNANHLFDLGIDEGPVIAYKIRDSLYLNITNRCTSSCVFCVRNSTPFVKGHNLKLDKEPSLQEVLSSLDDPKICREIVFCGYGEPTMRLDLVKAAAKRVKEMGVKTRLVTNGHGDLINARPIAAELAGLIDKVSVSLNADSEEKYNNICPSEFGLAAYKGVLSFIKGCVKNRIETEVTCLDLPKIDIKKCEEIAVSLGAKFRLRRAGIVG